MAPLPTLADLNPAHMAFHQKHLLTIATMATIVITLSAFAPEGGRECERFVVALAIGDAAGRLVIERACSSALMGRAFAGALLELDRQMPAGK